MVDEDVLLGSFVLVLFVCDVIDEYLLLDSFVLVLFVFLSCSRWRLLEDMLPWNCWNYALDVVLAEAKFGIDIKRSCRAPWYLYSLMPILRDSIGHDVADHTWVGTLCVYFEYMQKPEYSGIIGERNSI